MFQVLEKFLDYDNVILLTLASTLVNIAMIFSLSHEQGRWRLVMAPDGSFAALYEW